MTKNKIGRVVAIACLGVVAVQVVVLWVETGGGVLTRYFDPQRAVMERVSRDIAAFGDRDDDEFWEKDPNRFRLGLLPAGADKHVVSVVTLAGPLLIAMALLIGRRGDSRGK